VSNYGKYWFNTHSSPQIGGAAGGNLGRLARTAVHLQPGQLGQRARLRAQRVALHRLPGVGRWLLAGPDPATAAGWPTGYRPLDQQLCPAGRHGPALRAGRLTLLGVTRTLGPAADWPAADWAQPREPLLWRFHLHYWDWAWSLAGEPDRPAARELFAAVWRSWRAAVAPGHGVPWHPYPAALRAWSWCGMHGALVAGSDLDGPFLASLASHAGFLRRHLERDVGGNHLIKNLKALAGLAVFFADDALLGQVLDRLDRQLAVQVLADGGHYERAPAYHCQVLADLIDLAGLLRAAGHRSGPELPDAIRQMRGWLGAVLSPGGNVPLLNDGFPVSRDLIALLRPGPRPSGPVLLLPDTGLVWATAGDWQLLADVGPPCPAELPAHAHADTLSCLLHVDGQPLLVDTGTSSYAPGADRSQERSTAAHNTVEVDGTDSTEVWGTFRAARRARVRGVTATATAGQVSIEAAHDGYRALPGRPDHRRRWSLSAAGLQVDDAITGRGQHRVVARWHLPPGTRLRLATGGAVASTPAGEFAVRVTASTPPVITAGLAPVATGFGRRVQAPMLSCGVDAALPVRISTNWARLGPPQEPA
jgi:uncharacterized heparinase superfamily protein